MNNIYMYDNHTGVIIPSKIDTLPIVVLSGATVGDLHKAIEPHSKLFCVFTTLKDADIIVPSEEEANIVKRILDMNQSKEYKVEVKESVSWYTDKVDKNIIISGDLMDEKMISSFFTIYLDLLKDINKGISRIKEVKQFVSTNREIYYVMNTRTNKITIKVPRLEDAKRICNENPCLVVKNRQGKIIHKSTYGRVKLIKKDKSKTYTSKPETINNTNSKAVKIAINTRV